MTELEIASMIAASSSTSMIQWIINLMVVIVGGLGGFILKNMSKTIADLKDKESESADKLQKVELLVVGKYVTAEQLDRHTTQLYKKLDDIANKLDNVPCKVAVFNNNRREQ